MDDMVKDTAVLLSKQSCDEYDAFAYYLGANIGDTVSNVMSERAINETVTMVLKALKDAGYSAFQVLDKN